MNERQIAFQDFQKIPGVGVEIANDLWGLGYKSVADLKEQEALSI